MLAELLWRKHFHKNVQLSYQAQSEFSGRNSIYNYSGTIPPFIPLTFQNNSYKRSLLRGIGGFESCCESVNESAGPNELVSTLLVYDDFEQVGLRSGPSSLSSYQRACALRLAFKTFTEYISKARFPAALNIWNCHQTLDIHKIPVEGHMLVCRPIQIVGRVL